MPHQDRSSALRPVLEKVYAAPDRDSALKILTDYLAASDCAIPASQRRTMLVYANRCQTLASLQTYVTNSFLYYEGNGVKNPQQKAFFRK